MQKMKTQEKSPKIADKLSKYKYYFVLLTAILLAFPLIYILFHNHLLLGNNPYYDIRLAEHAKTFDLQKEDSLIYNGRPFFYNPFHFLLGFFSYLMPITYAYQIIGFLCAIATVLLLFEIMKRLKIGELDAPNNLIFYTLGFFITSPLFIYLFTVSVPNALAITLTLLGFLIFLGKWKESHPENHGSTGMKNSARYVISFIFLMLASMFSFFNTALICIMLIIYSAITKRRLKGAIIVSALLIIMAFSLNLGFFYNFDYPYDSYSFIKESFTDFGGVTGFTLLSVLFSAIGFIVSWNQKKKYPYLYLILGFMAVSSYFFGAGINMYTNLIVSFLAAMGLHKIVSLKWELGFIKKITVMAIVCMIMFSAIAYTKSIVNTSPDKDVIKSLIILKYMKQKNGVVISSIENGFLIQELADMPVLADPLMIYSKDSKNMIAEFKGILHETKLSDLVEKMKMYDATYVLIDSRMMQYLWDNSSKELALLITNDETFKNEYNLNQVSIFRFIGSRYNSTVR